MNNDTIKSPFVPLLIVFTSLLVMFCYQTRQSYLAHTQLNERIQLIKEQQAKFDSVLPTAETVNSRMVNLSKDLVGMAGRSPSAKKIVDDFRIQISQPVGGTKAAPSAEMTVPTP